jgi:hypothetical protein
MGDNVEQLFTAQPAATSSYGWRPSGPDTLDVPQVDYGGQRLLRRTGLSEVMNRVELTPGSRATTLGVAVHADGSSYPWAVSARNLTYIGEVPFSYVDTKDRYLAAADIIERTVAPDTPNRKRALIRIEDVGPNTDPGQIRAIADLLSARGVPFSLATYPYYRDPLGAAHNGTPASFRLVDARLRWSTLCSTRANAGQPSSCTATATNTSPRATPTTPPVAATSSSTPRTSIPRTPCNSTDQSPPTPAAGQQTD